MSKNPYRKLCRIQNKKKDYMILLLDNKINFINLPYWY
jgi:hypothetical protein